MTPSDLELVARELKRLGDENRTLKRRLGDIENRHEALREEYDLFREVMLEQLGIRSLKVLRQPRGAMTVIA